ncbi:hypothetical protein ACS127_15610 [Amphibacillus sp. Q70]|uniref:hypothetical protein n=1 Tax=Amphibacillus sp. Q70 TaxID=3453416 RepID=UPI003F8305AC
MKTLFLFEFKKLLKQKTIWFLVAVTMIAILVLYGFQSVMTATTRQQMLDQYDFLIHLNLESIEGYAHEQEQAIEADDEAWLEEAKIMENNAHQGYEKRLRIKEDYQAGDFEQMLQNQLDFLEVYIDPYNGSGYSIGEQDQLVSNFTHRATYAEKQYLLENQIDPFVQNDYYTMFLSTAYDDFTGIAQEHWQEITNRYSTKGVYYLYQLIQNLYLPAVILIGCFIFGNTFSSEMQEKTKKIRFHQVLPFEQGRLLIAKFSAGYLALFLYVIVMITLPLIMATVVDHFGSLDYPVLVYDGYTTDVMADNQNLDTFHFITLKTYFSKAFLLAITSSLLIYGLYYFFSQWSREPILTALLTGITCYLGLLIPAPYNPFQYLKIDQVITQEIQLQTWNTAFNFTTGILLTFLIGLLFVLANYKFFKRKCDR